MIGQLVELSNDERIDALLSGVKWGGSGIVNSVELSYSIPSATSTWRYTTEIDAGWYSLNNSQVLSFETALQGWADVADITFTRIPDGQLYGDIRIAYSHEVEEGTAAYAYLPYGENLSARGIFTADDESGDIWLHPDTTEFSAGSFGLHTLSHELGHALGLKHSFEAENGFPELDISQDHTGYTLMSYTDSTAAGYTYTQGDNNNYESRIVMPTTPMLYDILAIQHLYGANMSTRAGDSLYSFGTRAELMTIWDGGGTDTINLSNQLVGARLDLNPGTFSDIGLCQMTYQGELEQANDNIAIAFGVDIEHAVGTFSADILIGNALDNTLTGGAGDDQLEGGGGEDTAVFSGSSAEYTFAQTDTDITITGLDGSDTLSGIELFRFDNETLTLNDLPLSDGSIITRQEAPPAIDFRPIETEVAYFLLQIDKPRATSVSVNYHTRDGSAKAGEDYIATSGVATLLPGHTWLTLAVTLVDDNRAEGHEHFKMVISDPSEGVLASGDTELTAERIIVDNDLFG